MTVPELTDAARSSNVMPAHIPLMRSIETIMEHEKHCSGGDARRKSLHSCARRKGGTESSQMPRVNPQFNR